MKFSFSGGSVAWCEAQFEPHTLLILETSNRKAVMFTAISTADARKVGIEAAGPGAAVIVFRRGPKKGIVAHTAKLAVNAEAIAGGQCGESAFIVCPRVRA